MWFPTALSPRNHESTPQGSYFHHHRPQGHGPGRILGTNHTEGQRHMMDFHSPVYRKQYADNWILSTHYCLILHARFLIWKRGQFYFIASLNPFQSEWAGAIPGFCGALRIRVDGSYWTVNRRLSFSICRYEFSTGWNLIISIKSLIEEHRTQSLVSTTWFESATFVLLAKRLWPMIYMFHSIIDLTSWVYPSLNFPRVIMIVRHGYNL